MLKHYLLYIPARLIPAVASLASVAVLTRFLGVEEYGLYTLALTVIYTAQSFFNQWLCQGILRYYPEAEKNDSIATLLASSGLMSLLAFGFATLALLAAGWTQILPLDNRLLMVTLPVFVIFALQSLALRVPMATINSVRYSILVIVQALVSLGLAAFLAWQHAKPEFVLMGFAGGYALALLLDIRTVTRFLPVWKASRQTMKTIFVYGWPISLTTTLTFLAGKIDRFILEDILDAGAVGAYAAGSGLAEQAIVSLFTTIAMVGHPLAFRALASGDKAALQERLLKNATMIFCIGIPASVGFLMVTNEIANVFLGAEFRATAKALMPWIVLSAFISGIRAHYFDHAFHLCHKNHLLIVTLLPTLALNIALNYWLVPKFGVVAAAWSSCISYGFSLIGSLWLTRRVFPMPLPWENIWKTIVASLIMTGWLALLELFVPLHGWMLLLLKMMIGGAVFASCCWFFDIADARRTVIMALAKRRQKHG